MNIIIFCDMEGISGIYRQSQVTAGSADYQEACRSMTRDVNACVQGCFDGGAEKVVVRDVHSTCSNIIWAELDSRVDYLLAGIPGRNRFEGIDKFAGLILLGYHAMAGTQNGILAHTSSSAWQNCWLNDRKVGEFFLDGTRAGEHDVPVIMTSGDDKLCAEAQVFQPGITAVQVKEGMSRESGKLLPAEEACRRIREGATAAVGMCHKTALLKVSSPVKLRIEYAQGVQFSAVSLGVSQIDARTFEAIGQSVEEAVNRLVD